MDDDIHIAMAKRLRASAVVLRRLGYHHAVDEAAEHALAESCVVLAGRLDAYAEALSIEDEAETSTDPDDHALAA